MKKTLEMTIFEFVLLIALVAFIGFKVGYIVASPPIVYTDKIVTVHYGDTIWSIAESMTKNDEDIRDVVRRICETNELKTKHIYPGQTLTIPVVKE